MNLRDEPLTTMETLGAMPMILIAVVALFCIPSAWRDYSGWKRWGVVLSLVGISVFFEALATGYTLLMLWEPS